MITTSYLRSIGYTPTKSATIMQCLKKLGCEVKTVRISSSYHRNGVKCDLMYFGNGISRIQAVKALRAYVANIPKEANLSNWKEILRELEND